MYFLIISLYSYDYGWPVFCNDMRNTKNNLHDVNSLREIPYN